MCTPPHPRPFPLWDTSAPPWGEGASWSRGAWLDVLMWSLAAVSVHPFILPLPVCAIAHIISHN